MKNGRWIFLACRGILLIAISLLDPILNEYQGLRVQYSTTLASNLQSLLPVITICLSAWIGGRYALLTAAYTAGMSVWAFHQFDLPHERHPDELFVGMCFVSGMLSAIFGLSFTAAALHREKRKTRNSSVPEREPEYGDHVWPPAPRNPKGTRKPPSRFV
jgi:hypothetical protein